MSTHPPGPGVHGSAVHWQDEPPGPGGQLPAEATGVQEKAHEKEEQGEEKRVDQGSHSREPRLLAVRWAGVGDEEEGDEETSTERSDTYDDSLPRTSLAPISSIRPVDEEAATNDERSVSADDVAHDWEPSGERGGAPLIVDEYGYARSRTDLTTENVSSAFFSLERQRRRWDHLVQEHFPGGVFDREVAQYWRRDSSYGHDLSRAPLPPPVGGDGSVEDRPPPVQLAHHDTDQSTCSSSSGLREGGDSPSSGTTPKTATPFTSPSYQRNPSTPHSKRRVTISFPRVKRSASHAFTKAVRHGVPPELRMQVWMACTGAEDKKRAASAQEQFASVLSRAEGRMDSCSTQIEKDLYRTLPTNTHFQCEEGISCLRNVLLAYSERNKEIGYCQSMNFIAAILLLHMEPENAFWCLAAVVEDILPRHWFDGELHGSLVEPRVLGSCLEWKMPKLSRHMRRLGVQLEVVTYPWFLCLYTNTLPLEPLLRVWDCFFHEGIKALQRVALGLLWLRQEEILEIEDELEIFELLRNPSIAIHCETRDPTPPSGLPAVLQGTNHGRDDEAAQSGSSPAAEEGETMVRFSTAFTADELFETSYKMRHHDFTPEEAALYFKQHEEERQGKHCDTPTQQSGSPPNPRPSPSMLQQSTGSTESGGAPIEESTTGAWGVGEAHWHSESLHFTVRGEGQAVVVSPTSFKQDVLQSGTLQSSHKKSFLVMHKSATAQKDKARASAARRSSIFTSLSALRSYRRKSMASMFGHTAPEEDQGVAQTHRQSMSSSRQSTSSSRRSRQSEDEDFENQLEEDEMEDVVLVDVDGQGEQVVVAGGEDHGGDAHHHHGHPPSAPPSSTSSASPDAPTTEQQGPARVGFFHSNSMHNLALKRAAATSCMASFPSARLHRYQEQHMRDLEEESRRYRQIQGDQDPPAVVSCPREPETETLAREDGTTPSPAPPLLRTVHRRFDEAPSIVETVEAEEDRFVQTVQLGENIREVAAPPLAGLARPTPVAGSSTARLDEMEAQQDLSIPGMPARPAGYSDGVVFTTQRLRRASTTESGEGAMASFSSDGLTAGHRHSWGRFRGDRYLTSPPRYALLGRTQHVLSPGEVSYQRFSPSLQPINSHRETKFLLPDKLSEGEMSRQRQLALMFLNSACDEGDEGEGECGDK